jgi:hypothetical protein
MLGIHLPINHPHIRLNFSIIDFWRRWYLAYFLVGLSVQAARAISWQIQALYQPAGHNGARRTVAWSELDFVLWGRAWVFLVINHVCKLVGSNGNRERRIIQHASSWLITFLRLLRVGAIQGRLYSTAMSIYGGCWDRMGFCTEAIHSKLALY